MLADIGHRTEGVDVAHVNRHLCEIRHGRAIRLDNGPDVFQDLCRLGPDIAFAHQLTIRVQGDLSGDEKQRAAIGPDAV